MENNLDVQSSLSSSSYRARCKKCNWKSGEKRSNEEDAVQDGKSHSTANPGHKTEVIITQRQWELFWHQMAGKNIETYFNSCPCWLKTNDSISSGTMTLRFTVPDWMIFWGRRDWKFNSCLSQNIQLWPTKTTVSPSGFFAGVLSPTNPYSFAR